MSYQVLARKWRPHNFEDMVGQGHVLKTLANALNTDRLHHAYLFTGTRGVGKTTLARILAKCFNCEKGVSSTPCNECSACTGIDEGRFVDLIEVDAASRAKVEETRDLMDNVQYAPSVGRYKVYLIDEVHMFSNHSFNALLKTLEEPPPHVKFLLATTEPKKLPVTILSRCLQFNLKHLTSEQIGDQIRRILKEEEIQSDDESVRLLSVAANGSMRDALSLLDQAVAYNQGELEQTQIREMLGTIDSTDIDGLIEALVDNAPQALFEQIDQIAAFNADYDAVLAALLSRFHEIAIAQTLAENTESLDENSHIFAGKLSREDVQLYYQIGLNGRRDLFISPDPRSGFEMTMIRMLAFRPMKKVPVNANSSPQPAEVGEVPRTEEVQATPKRAAEAENNNWLGLIEAMELDGLTREMASQCILKEANDKRIRLAIAPLHRQFLDTAQKDRLLTALKKHHGNGVAVDIVIEELDQETPAEQLAREAKARRESAVAGFVSDSNVQAMVDAFDGTLNKDSIQTQ